MDLNTQAQKTKSLKNKSQNTFEAKIILALFIAYSQSSLLQVFFKSIRPRTREPQALEFVHSLQGHRRTKLLVISHNGNYYIVQRFPCLQLNSLLLEGTARHVCVFNTWNIDDGDVRYSSISMMKSFCVLRTGKSVSRTRECETTVFIRSLLVYLPLPDSWHRRAERL